MYVSGFSSRVGGWKMNGDSRRLITVGLVVAISAMMCTVAGIGGSGVGASARHSDVRTPGPILAISTPRIYAGARSVLSQEFPGTAYEFSIAAHGNEVASVAFLDNGSSQLYLSYANNNTSRFLGYMPGGSMSDAEGFIAAGNHFILSIYNFSTGRDSFEEIALSGTVSTPTLPLGANLIWWFAYGNATSYFATATGYLVELNAKTGAVIANYSRLVSPRLDLTSVLPSGNLLYVAGTLTSPSGTNASAYFGVLNPSNHTLSRISKIHYYPANYFGYFESIGLIGGYVYVGGGVQYLDSSTATIYTVAGYLYRYTPSTGTFVNRSASLGLPTAWIWAMEPWRSSLLLYAAGYSYTATTSSSISGIYRLGSGGGLVNKSTLLPTGFEGDDVGVTSASAGWVYLGGDNTVSGVAELVGIPG